MKMKLIEFNRRGAICVFKKSLCLIPDCVRQGARYPVYAGIMSGRRRQMCRMK